MSWINAAHLHGVPILGTYIVENESGDRLLKEVLESETKMLEIVDCLVTLASRLNFDGWLLHIECSVDNDKIPLLEQFVKELTTRLHQSNSGLVFWFDSVTSDGTPSSQNQLNENNIKFFEMCDGILINHKWNDDDLHRSARILRKDPTRMTKVFMGIDVFGRGQVGQFRSLETLAKIKEFDFSIGVLAPAWTFERTLEIGLNPFKEHNDDTLFQHFMERDHLLWALMWQHLYTSGPTIMPFTSSFCMGSGKATFEDGGRADEGPWFNIMKQEYQTSVPSLYGYDFDDGFRGGLCLKIRKNVENLRLFVSSFDCDQDIIVSYVYKPSSPDIHVELVLKVVNDLGKVLFVLCGNDRPAKSHWAQKRIPLLDGSNLSKVVQELSEQKDETTILPSDRSVDNDWNTRFYYIKLNSDAKSSRIVDIGVTVEKEGEWCDGSLKLGAVHVQRGNLSDDAIEIANDTQIRSQDFE